MVVTKRYNVLMCHANMKADRCFRIIPQYCSLVNTLSVLSMSIYFKIFRCDGFLFEFGTRV